MTRDIDDPRPLHPTAERVGVAASTSFRIPSWEIPLSLLLLSLLLPLLLLLLLPLLLPPILLLLASPPLSIHQTSSTPPNRPPVPTPSSVARRPNVAPEQTFYLFFSLPPPQLPLPLLPLPPMYTHDPSTARITATPHPTTTEKTRHPLYELRLRFGGAPPPSSPAPDGGDDGRGAGAGGEDGSEGGGGGVKAAPPESPTLPSPRKSGSWKVERLLRSSIEGRLALRCSSVRPRSQPSPIPNTEAMAWQRWKPRGQVGFRRGRGGVRERTWLLRALGLEVQMKRGLVRVGSVGPIPIVWRKGEIEKRFDSLKIPFFLRFLQQGWRSLSFFKGES